MIRIEFDMGRKIWDPQYSNSAILQRRELTDAISFDSEIGRSSEIRSGRFEALTVDHTEIAGDVEPAAIDLFDGRRH